MNEWKKNDPLWNLLGHGRPVKEAPYLSRRVMTSLPARVSRLTLLLRWLTPIPVCAAAILAWSTLQQPAEITPASDFNAYFDAAADLENLVATEDTSTWAEKDPF